MSVAPIRWYHLLWCGTVFICWSYHFTRHAIGSGQLSPNCTPEFLRGRTITIVYRNARNPPYISSIRLYGIIGPALNSRYQLLPNSSSGGSLPGRCWSPHYISDWLLSYNGISGASALEFFGNWRVYVYVDKIVDAATIRYIPILYLRVSSLGCTRRV